MKSIKNIIGTRRWVAQLLGSWNRENVIIETAPKHDLPLEVRLNISANWEQVMRRVGTEIGIEGEDWRIVPNEPYAKLEIKKGDKWALRMFAGDQTRIEDYFIKDGKLNLIHSPANYAESLATNNTNPWELIQKYGNRTALADGHAVSVAITAIDDKGKEVIQFFRRGKGLGEYGGYIGTAAGNSMKTTVSPFDVAYIESTEESRVLPFISAYKASINESGIMPSLPNLDDYKRLGLATSDFEIIEELSGGKKVKYLDRKGNEAIAILVSPKTKYLLTGLALNIDAEDYDSKGMIKPHHKSEYLFVARTQLPLQVINDSVYGWVRNDEHANVMYVPFNPKDLTEFAVENFKEMMPPTHAVALSAIRSAFGNDAYENALDATNARYPMTSDHPLISIIKSGKYELPKLILKH